MPLPPNGLTALTLWLCGGRYFDYECCPVDDDEGSQILISARGIVDGAAKIAQTKVRAWPKVAPFLVEKADDISHLRRAGPRDLILSMIVAAEEYIRSTASNVAAGDKCDGPAMTLNPYTPDRCGLLGLAAIIEARIRQLYSLEGGLPDTLDLQINYITVFAEDTWDFRPFSIKGTAAITQSPRLVHLVLRNDSITSRDLWHIAYTLHHELVCHIFQGACSMERLQDAHPKCHWSEGWMDTLAFDLVTDWSEAPTAWLPLRGENATGEIRRFFDSRYIDPPFLGKDNLRRRQQARDAYRLLGKVLFEHDICLSDAEARQRVRRFSLTANAHPAASSKRLKTLASKLILSLTTVARPEARVAAARACFAFTESHDLVKLEQEIEAAFQNMM